MTTWTPPAAHERQPAPRSPEKPGPGLDRSDIPAPLPGRPLWAIFATLLLIAALGWGTFNVIDLLAHGESHESALFAADGIETINVDNDAGWVEIAGTDGDEIRLEADISTGLRRTGYSWEVDGSTLQVRGTCPIIGTAWCWVKYTIEVPRGVEVVVNTDNDRVEVTGIEADVTVDADNGRVTLTDIAGSISVNGNNGSVEATGLSGPSANVEGDNGRIELAFTEPPENVVAKTDNGSVDIAVPPVDEGYDIVTSTGNGSTTTTGLVNDPRSPRVIRAETDNGSITIHSSG